MKVLVFGSLNIDYNYSVDHFVQKGETLLSSELSVFSGGKGLNQSIALAKAGADIYQAGCIGQDGLFLLELLNEAGAKIEYIDVRNDIRTGNAIIQNDCEGDNCILLYGGANQAVTKEYVDSVLANFAAGDFLVLQNEINEMAYIIDQAKAKEMVIILNPSPMNEQVRSYPLDKVDFFLVNEIEAMQILGLPLAEMDQELVINQLQERFPEAKIVLTLGGEGSLYKDQEQQVKQHCYRVKTVDTTAAGDTYTGYFIASLIKGLSVSEAMDLAARASAIAVTKKGAAPSIPYYEEVMQYPFEN